MFAAILIIWAVLSAVFRFEPLPTQWLHSSPIWAPSGHIVPPVPEPASIAVLAVGAIGLTMRRRRRG